MAKWDIDTGKAITFVIHWIGLGIIFGWKGLAAAVVLSIVVESRK